VSMNLTLSFGVACLGRAEVVFFIAEVCTFCQTRQLRFSYCMETLMARIDKWTFPLGY